MEEKKYDLDGYTVVSLLKAKRDTLKERHRVGQIDDAHYSQELEKIANQIDEILRTS